MFFIILVPSLFYLFPSNSDISPQNTPSSDLLSRLELKSVPSSAPDYSYKNDEPNEELQHASGKAEETQTYDSPQSTASSSGSILATVYLDLATSQIYLENTGSVELHQLQIRGMGRTLGRLSGLDCGEKKVLAVSGSPQDLQVTALDPDDGTVSAKVEYISPAKSKASPASAFEDVALSTKSAPDTNNAFASAGGSAPTSNEGAIEHDASPLQIDLVANKTDGRDGEVVGYRCTAKNVGGAELSDVQITCAGKVASTKYLPPNRELYLDGAISLNSNTRLSAGVQARDSDGRLYSNNSSAEIWLISPALNLKVVAKEKVHRGDRVNLQIMLENNGKENLTDVVVRDDREYIGLIGRIAKLPAGSFKELQKEVVIGQSIQDQVIAVALDPTGDEIYASERLSIEVLASALQIQGRPSEVRIYPGDPAEVTWLLSNTGEEALQNITLDGDGNRRILKDLPAGKTIEMAAIYIKNATTWINVTAMGFDENGFEVNDSAGIRLQSIEPDITIKAMPSEVEVCPGEEAEVNVLVSNTGDDRLDDVVLTLNGSTIATLGDLSPGEFRVIDTKTMIYDNCSILFEALGRDSMGLTHSEQSSVQTTCVVAALKVFASSSPAAAVPGESCKITCTVANTGMVPLNGIFVISKHLGPIGTIDFLSPKRQMTVTAQKTVNEAVEDIITVEGFTQDRASVRGSFPLSLKLLSSPNQASRTNEPVPGQFSDVTTTTAGIRFGNVSMPFNLPVQEETEREVSRVMASDADRAAKKQNNVILDGISSLLRYVERLLGIGDGEDDKGQGPSENVSQSEVDQGLAPRGTDSLAGSKDYELSIEGVKGSEHGAISILDVNALPSQPAANEPVKVTVHLISPEGVKSTIVKYGLSDLPLTKQDMQGVDRVYDCALALESGSPQDGYWSGSIPGRGAGTYMPLSVWISDGSSTAEGGPYLIHWSTVNSVGSTDTVARSSGSGMLFIESSSVKGSGEVSIKDTILGSTMEFNEKIIGNGSISLETMRCIDRSGPVDSFTEKKDLVFDGNIKGHKTVASPTFHGGMGASVTERFNLSHVDKSETSSVSSNSFANNTLKYKTDQAFDGTWNIQTKYAKFYKKIKADQKYTGSFQTQKDIEFTDAGVK
jgi:hypothetical protein